MPFTFCTEENVDMVFVGCAMAMLLLLLWNTDDIIHEDISQIGGCLFTHTSSWRYMALF
jgi:hypothetical protein